MAPANPKRKAKGTLANKETHKLVIAIDFGTTHSGCAWLYTASPESRHLIEQWPDTMTSNLGGHSSARVPSEIQYIGNEFKWGFQIPASEPRQKWLKLDLDPSQTRSLFSLAPKLPDRRALPPGYDLNVERMITDYLKAFRKHVDYVIELGSLNSPVVANTPRRYCLTVPAVWSDRAQALTRSVAEAAGLNEDGNLVTVTEPEAAALYSLTQMRYHDLEVGDTFVLCDAGGGTVDLISYKVKAIHPVLQLTEAASGTGAICGGVFVNRLFEQYLIERFGGDKDWNEQILEEAMERFEFTVKRDFNGDANQQFWIPLGLADNVALGIRRGKIVVTGKELKSFTQPVFDEIITLIKGQIRNTAPNIPKAVLLVGGFGQSVCLRETIKVAIAGSGISLIQPPNGLTAIAQGGLISALASDRLSAMPVSVSARAARRFYGLKILVPFDTTVHDPSKRVWYGFHGTWMIPVMDWVIRKGETVKESEPKSFRYSSTFLVADGRPKDSTIDILSFDGLQGEDAPIYRSGKIKDLAKLTVNLPGSNLKLAMGKDGNLYYRFQYEIAVTLTSGYIKYELIFEGTNYGTVRAEYV